MAQQKPKGEEGNEFTEALGMAEVSRFEVEPSGFEGRKQGLDAPVLADKLSVARQTSHLGVQKLPLKALQSVDALGAVAVAPLVQHRPEHREDYPFMDDAQHQDVEMNGTKRPISAVEAQGPGLRNLAPTHYRPRHIVEIHRKLPQKPSQTFVVRLRFRPVGQHRRPLIQVHRVNSEEGHQKQGEKGQSGTMPRQMSTQGRLKSVHLRHGEGLAKVVLISSSPPSSSVCQPLHTEGFQPLTPSFVLVPWK